jgi:hypothetical protein
VLTSTQTDTLEALVERIVPSDEDGPGALGAGVVEFIVSELAGSLAELSGVYSCGLDARADAGDSFVRLDATARDRLLSAIDEAGAEHDDLNGFFEIARRPVIEGMFCDPFRGGNRGFVGWKLLGYPGVRLSWGSHEQELDTELVLECRSSADVPRFTVFHGTRT